MAFKKRKDQKNEEKDHPIILKYVSHFIKLNMVAIDWRARILIYQSYIEVRRVTLFKGWNLFKRERN